MTSWKGAEYWDNVRRERDEEWTAWLETDLTDDDVEYLEKLITLTTPQPWGLYAGMEVHERVKTEGWLELENLDKKLNDEGPEWASMDSEGNWTSHSSPRYLMGSSSNIEELAMFYSGYHPGRANMQFVISARRFLPRLLAQVKRNQSPA